MREAEVETSGGCGVDEGVLVGVGVDGLGVPDLCEEPAGDTAAGESMLTWLRSTDCLREMLGGLDGGGVVDLR